MQTTNNRIVAFAAIGLLLFGLVPSAQAVEVAVTPFGAIDAEFDDAYATLYQSVNAPADNVPVILPDSTSAGARVGLLLNWQWTMTVNIPLVPNVPEAPELPDGPHLIAAVQQYLEQTLPEEPPEVPDVPDGPELRPVMEAVKKFIQDEPELKLVETALETVDEIKDADCLSNWQATVEELIAALVSAQTESTQTTMIRDVPDVCDYDAKAIQFTTATSASESAAAGPGTVNAPDVAGITMEDKCDGYKVKKGPFNTDKRHVRTATVEVNTNVLQGHLVGEGLTGDGSGSCKDSVGTPVSGLAAGTILVALPVVGTMDVSTQGGEVDLGPFGGGRVEFLCDVDFDGSLGGLGGAFVAVDGYGYGVAV